jgi:putative SOS response-associated peptidase YedK
MGAKGGQRFAISRCDGKPLALAGLWEGYRAPDGKVTRSYCIITTEANELIAPIHDRMPLVIEEQDLEPFWKIMDERFCEVGCRPWR